MASTRGRTCDACGTRLRLVKFRYQEGYVCRSCYDRASLCGHRIIRGMGREELEQALREGAAGQASGVEFFPTRRVGDLLLVDDYRGVVCLPNNRRVVGAGHAPVYLRSDEIEASGIRTSPQFSKRALAQLARDKGDRQDVLVSELVVWVRARRAEDCGKARTFGIPLIASSVRASSYAFKRTYELAVRAQGLVVGVSEGNSERK